MSSINKKLDNYLKDKLGLGIKEIFEQKDFSLLKKLKAKLRIRDMEDYISVDIEISEGMNISIIDSKSSLDYTGESVEFFNDMRFELKGLSIEQDDYGKRVFLCKIVDFVEAIK